MDKLKGSRLPLSLSFSFSKRFREFHFPSFSPLDMHLCLIINVIRMLQVLAILLMYFLVNSVERISAYRCLLKPYIDLI